MRWLASLESAAGLLVCALLFSGCTSRGACTGERVAACVGEQRVQIADLEFEVRRSRLSGSGLAALGTLSPRGRQRILDDVINSVALSEAALEAGLDRSADVAAEIEGTRRRILARRYLEAAMEKDPLDEPALRAYYHAHARTFRRPEEVRVRQLAVASSEEGDRVRAEVLAGADMAEVAKRVNTDASRASGGALGWIHRGKMEQSFEDVAFGLAPGELSTPVRTSFGWHVIRIEERRGGNLPPFDEVRAQVKKAAEGERLGIIAAEARRRLSVVVTSNADQWVSTTHGLEPDLQ